MSTQQEVSPRPRVGRPSLAVDRRRQVLSAFIDLISERGLERVTLDDVAAAAGVQRSVIRHYVGNRTDLVRDAVEMLADRYGSLVQARLGPTPSVTELVDHLFSADWVTGMAAEDRALDVLLQEAVRDDVTRDRIRVMYQAYVDGIAAAIRAENPSVKATAAKQVAYQVVCLAEHNAMMQRLGLAAGQSKATHHLARRIVDEVS
jgi:AcrR family transcriptional regulator